MRRHQIMVEFSSEKTDDEILKIVTEILDKWFFDIEVKNIRVMHREMPPTGAGQNGTP